MLKQKIIIFPDIQSSVLAAPKPLIFWKRIKKNADQELHLALLVEGRTDQETLQLGRELWDMLSAYENELVINKNGLANPEFVCESLLKVANDYLTNFSHRTQVNNWSDLGIVILVASSAALYFARIGRPRLILFRDNQIILADENLTHPRSPQFSPPFAELAGGAINLGDRLLLISGTITEAFSWEEVYSLAAHPHTSQAYLNVVRSLEVISPSINSAFLFGDVVAENIGDEVFANRSNVRLRENRVGDLYFQEFNPTFREPAVATATSFVPWQEILAVSGQKIFSVFKLIGRIIGFPLKPLGRRIGALSPTRKVILGILVIILLALGTLIFRSVSRPTAKNTAPAVDFQTLYDQANRLKDEASDALIYQDEEKARKNLAQADSLLEQASQSGDLGIKALKLKKEVDDQLATLDKAQASQSSSIWTTSDDQEVIKGIGFQNNGNILLITNKKGWDIKPADSKPEAQSFSDGQNIGEGLLATTNTDRLFLSSEDKLFYVINAATKNISAKKDLPAEVKPNAASAATYGSSVYFFDPDESQIKQFNYQNGELVFKSNWLKQDLKGDFRDNPAVSMSIDGSVFLVTQKGDLWRLSGGKKSAWNVEKPGAAFQGDKLVIQANPDNNNLYLLDPDNKRIVIFEKETGKLKGQVQNDALAKAVGFQVSEKNKVIYFVTSGSLFKLTFTP